MAILPPFHAYPKLDAGNFELREPQKADAPKLLDISYYDGFKASTVAEAEEILERIYNDYQAGKSLHWVIVQKETQEIVGSCGYYRGFENSRGELGVILLEPFQGKRIVGQILPALVHFGKDTLQLNQVVALSEKNNFHAHKSLLINGFIFNSIDEEKDLAEFVWP